MEGRTNNYRFHRFDNFLSSASVTTIILCSIYYTCIPIHGFPHRSYSDLISHRIAR